MRLDLFLKTAGLVKRRTVAKSMCDRGRVQVAGRPAKAGSAVRPNQELSIDYGQRRLVVRVLQVPERPVSKDCRNQLYAVEKTIYRTPGATEEPQR